MSRSLLPILGVLLLTGCSAGSTAGRSSPGNAELGRQLVVEYGCVSCHSIGGVGSVDDESVAPDLHGLAERDVIAGHVPHRLEELIQWLQDPQAIAPGTLMPDLGVNREDAEDIIAFLYEQ